MTWQEERIYLNQELEREQMNYKESYKVPRRLVEISDQELLDAWWWAFRRDDDDEINCDTKALRRVLEKLLNGT